MAGVSITDVVPTRTIAARPTGFARSPARPVGRSAASPRPRIEYEATASTAGSRSRLPAAVDKPPGQQPPRRHDVRIVRHEQVRDRALPGPRRLAT